MTQHKQQDDPSDSDFPWWLVVTLLIGAWLGYRIVSDDLYTEVFGILVKGIGVTTFVTVTAFTLASALGLLLAAAVLSPWLVVRQCARFYIEIMRGIPMLVLLFYIAFVAAPGLVTLANALFGQWMDAPLRTRDFSLMWRAIAALTLGYSAFIAEVFRAGILSVGRGQSEAALSLGLTPFSRFRYVIFPQAFRTILPPLGNDFIAMIKDSALVSVLGVADITQLGKIYAAGSFRFMETYNIVAYIYLLVTIVLSLLLRRLESRLRQSQSQIDPGS
ncbi:amino acid ABC transporter permease [Granulosicoccus antarcticus]|uniref:Glutamine transport system permease protein GlnP n=1 Tax=Granulosicoccus antarcticus IMCC3135 TaxID=1192854 RepID=A0A2Z2NQ02_9GAMM|nr:amino acid ABC transporter permease [Granulosicoccus antarcticus]ASJ71738.1 Glutamine transport system permease protein GlnP [Granulosicoccus antarcticus IMCC3135]